MQYVAIAASVMSAAGSIQQGKSQNEMYKLQAQQAKLKASRDALQYEQQANMLFERLIQTNATAAAKGFAGGVQGFSGSAKLIQERNKKVAGRDVQILNQSSADAILFGDTQASLFKAAGKQAKTASYFDAIAKLGNSAYAYGQTSSGTTVTKAPVVDKSFYP
jgi:hypothetical protein